MTKKECIEIAKKLGYTYDKNQYEYLPKSQIWFDGTERTPNTHIIAHNIKQSKKWTNHFKDMELDHGSWFIEIGLTALYNPSKLDDMAKAYPDWYKPVEEQETPEETTEEEPTPKTTGEHIITFINKYALVNDWLLNTNTMELYELYKGYCTDNNIEPINNKSFILFVKILTDCETVSKRVWNKKTKKYEHVNMFKLS